MQYDRKNGYVELSVRELCLLAQRSGSLDTRLPSRSLALRAGTFSWKPLIDSAAHLRHIFSRLLLAEKLDVHPVHLAFFAIADEKICTESVPPHSISVSLNFIS